MKKRKTRIIYYLAVIVLTLSFTFLFKQILSQNYVPITNHFSGISINIQGTEGTDYIYDRYYFDPLVNDEGICYIKSDVNIALTHNANNVRMHKLTNEMYLRDIVEGGDFGNIRMKMDRDWQYAHWAGDNAIVTYNNIVAKGYGWYYRANVYPEYSGPFSFNNLEYEPGVPVLGSIGPNPGGVLNLDTTDRKDFYYRGMLDQAGNEYHYLTYADDDDQHPDSVSWKTLELSVSDGKSMLFCVNPKTPVIWLRAATTGAEYYTTPAKVWWIPKIHEQTSYVTDGVDIQLKNIMNSNTVYYRIDGGSYQAYTGPISSNTLSDGEHTLEFYYNSSDVQTRKIIKNPDHPSKSDIYEGDTERGYILWKDETEFLAWKDRMLNGTYKDEYLFYKADKINPLLNANFPAGIRNPSDALGVNDFLMLAVVPIVEGVSGNEAYFNKAKEFLLHNRIMHLENMGFELQYTQDPKPSSTLYYKGYYDDWLLYNNAITYDLMAKFYRSDQYAGGMTAIEDLRIRDMLAKVSHEDLMVAGGLKLAMLENMDDVYWDTYRYGGMQVYMHQAAGCFTSMIIPSYNTKYYGTCGLDGTPATHPWAPYPDHPKSWKNFYFDYTDFRNPKHTAKMHGFPNQCFMYSWWNGSAIDDGFITANGDWGGKHGYSSPDLCGHGIELFYNVTKRKFNNYYHTIHECMKKSLDGTLYCYTPDGPHTIVGKPRLMMANEYFPDLAPTAMYAYNEDGAYKKNTRPMYFFFNNPDWASCGAAVNGVNIGDTIYIYQGDSTIFHATINPANASNITVEWETSNPSVATIDEDGVAWGINPGEVTITVTTDDGGFTDECILIVNPTLINFAPSGSAIGDTQYSYSYPYSNAIDGDKMTNAGRWVSANSSYPHWLEIDLLTQREVRKVNFWTGSETSTPSQYSYPIYDFKIQQWTGSAWVDIIDSTNNQSSEVSIEFPPVNTEKIRLYCTDGQDNLVRLYEMEVLGYIYPTSVIVTPASLTLDVSNTANLTATVLPTNANYQGVRWSTNNADVATVDAGVVTGVSAGTATITVTTLNGGFTDICTVTVTGGSTVPVTGVSVSPTSLSLNVSGTSDLTETVLPANATDKSVNWLSNDTTVATVDAGLVTAVAAGTAIITVTTTDGGFIDSCAVTVSTGGSGSVNLALGKPVMVDSYYNNDSITFAGSNAVDGDNSSNSSRWLSANTSYPHWIEIDLQQACSVDQIKFWTGYTTYRFPIQDYQLQYWTGSAWADIISPVTGNSSAEVTHSFAVVNTDKVRLYATAGQDNIIRMFEIEVWGTSSVSVTDVSVSPSTLTLNVGYTSDLTETVTPSNASDPTVIWTTTNDSVATVDSNGLVTAVAAGNCTIRATANDGSGHYDECAVIVNALVLTNLSQNKPVMVDTYYNTTYIGSKAVDGDISNNTSRWLSDNTAYPHWIEVDLQDNCDVSQIKFWTGYSTYRYPIHDYELQYWTGSAWVNIIPQITGNSSSEVTHSFTAVNTDKVRLYASAGQDNIVRMFEIEVWGYINNSKSQHKHESEFSTIVPVEKINIFPNPVINDEININLSGILNDDTIKLKIFDIYGNLHFISDNIVCKQGNMQCTIHHKFPTGIYFLVVYGNKQVKQQKFIVE